MRICESYSELTDLCKRHVPTGLVHDASFLSAAGMKPNDMIGPLSSCVSPSEHISSSQ